MSITPEQALAVGKLLYSGSSQRDVDDCIQDPRLDQFHIDDHGECRTGQSYGFDAYDPTEPAECWAMAEWLQALGMSVLLSERVNGDFMAIASPLPTYAFPPEAHHANGETQAEALVNLVLAIGGEG